MVNLYITSRYMARDNVYLFSKSQILYLGLSVFEPRQSHLAYMQNYLPNLIIKFSMLASFLFQNIFRICPKKYFPSLCLNLAPTSTSLQDFSYSTMSVHIIMVQWHHNAYKWQLGLVSCWSWPITPWLHSIAFF